MRNIRRVVRIVVILFMGLLLHYALPQRDIARVTSTEIIRTDFSSINRIFYAQADAGAEEQPTRDLRLINTVRKTTYLFGMMRGRDQVMVFRNEDTGWIWPPYFKFDSSDLQAEAADSVSSKDDPEWVAITHYGWRVRYLSIFPNAIAIKPIDGPDVRLIPWFNIFFFVFLIAAFLFLRAMWMQFRERTLDPLGDAANDRYDRVSADIGERRGRLRRWLDTWRSK